jgi:prepilin-type N-terminal cleavage/methylation domain-containing protein
VTRTRRDRGETLIEVLFTIVIVSITFSALFTGLATAGNASNLQRISVQADVVMRNFAEATKSAAQGCVYPGGGTYNVVFPLPGQTLPAGFPPPTVSGADAGTGVGVGNKCPSVTSTSVLTLQVTGPLSYSVKMPIKVNTP